MKFRKLRIAWSVFWGLACVLLVVLWVRSYWSSDGFEGSVGNWYCEGWSDIGQLSIGAYPSGYKAMFHVDSAPVSARKATRLEMQYGSFGVVAELPCWFAMVTAVALGAVVWIPLSFRLRTLLIATTLVAVVLGFAMYAASK